MVKRDESTEDIKEIHRMTVMYFKRMLEEASTGKRELEVTEMNAIIRFLRDNEAHYELTDYESKANVEKSKSSAIAFPNRKTAYGG